MCMYPYKLYYMDYMAALRMNHSVEPAFAYILQVDKSGDEKYHHYKKRHADTVPCPAWNGEILLHNNNQPIDSIRFSQADYAFRMTGTGLNFQSKNSCWNCCRGASNSSRETGLVSSSPHVGKRSAPHQTM